MNNYHLYNIEKFLVDYVQSVKDIVELNLYVVDDNLIRIVSTGALDILRGIPLTKNQLTYKVMEQKRPLYMCNPKESELCEGCEIKELGKCMEEHTLYYPIVIDGYAVGVIALFAVTDKEKQKLKSKLSDFERFLGQMAETIKLKLKETTNVHRLATLMEKINDSVIVTDIDDTVLFSNLLQLEGKSGMSLREIFNPADLDRLNEVGYDHPITINDEYGLGRSSLSKVIINPNERHIEKMYLMKSVEEEGKAATRIAYNGLDFIGSSHSSMLTRDMISKAADYDFNVLILGESGTGKGVIAEAIHKQSARKDKPFIDVNCSAIPSNLIESELFGYEAGAFSGASKNGKPGMFELANGGTIFLDEIGEMDIALQPKLLKVLDDKRVSRLGGVKSKKLDIRVIAATNKDVHELVRQKLFREDLYYRLAVMVIENEPLRSKTEDLIPLAIHFINKYNRKYNKSIKGLSQQVVKAFMQYDWPGNIRELENAIEYAVAVEEDKKISAQSLPRRILSNNPLVASTSLDDIKKNRIVELLNMHGRTAQGKQKVAESLGISLSTLYRYMKKFKIS